MGLFASSFRGLLAPLFVMLALAASGERRLAQLQFDQIDPCDLGDGDHVIDRALQGKVLAFAPGLYSLVGERPSEARAPLLGSNFAAETRPQTKTKDSGGGLYVLA